MRGQQSLYSSLFPCSVNMSNPNNKGRRSVLMALRDEALCCRYYYHAEFKRLRYDDCLAALEKEFFITAGVAMQRLEKNVITLKDITTRKPSISQLKDKYPSFNWN